MGNKITLLTMIGSLAGCGGSGVFTPPSDGPDPDCPDTAACLDVDDSQRDFSSLQHFDASDMVSIGFQDGEDYKCLNLAGGPPPGASFVKQDPIFYWCKRGSRERLIPPAGNDVYSLVEPQGSSYKLKVLFGEGVEGAKQCLSGQDNERGVPQFVECSSEVGTRWEVSQKGKIRNLQTGLCLTFDRQDSYRVIQASCDLDEDRVWDLEVL